MAPIPKDTNWGKTLTKAQWNHKEVQRNVFDQLERLVADLNAVLKKPE